MVEKWCIGENELKNFKIDGGIEARFVIQLINMQQQTINHIF